MYDHICKFLAENYANDFACWIFGEPQGLTQLNPTELFVDPIRADALILLQSSDIVLHLEFQTKPNKLIPFRMADYRLRVHRRYPDKDMRQVVIYLKPTSSELVHKNVFTISGLRHEFEVIRLWEKPTADFLKFPGLLPLAVLGLTEDRTQTLQDVSLLIDKLKNRREKSNIAAATSILAGLVLNKGVIQQLLREEIMQESVIYQDIKEQGIKQGQVSLVLRLLKRRLGKIESSDETRITGLSVEQLEALGEALLDFTNRNDLLAWLVNN